MASGAEPVAEADASKEVCTQAFNTCNDLLKGLEPLAERLTSLEKDNKPGAEAGGSNPQEGGWLESFFAGGGRRKRRGRGKTRAIRRPVKRTSHKRKSHKRTSHKRK